VAQREHLQVELDILADLEHAGVFEQWLHRRERRALLDLIGRDFAGEQTAVAAVAAFAVRQRNVASLVGGERKRETAQRRLHGIEARGLGIERDRAELARARDPGGEPVEAAHDLVAGAIDLGVARGREAGGRERLRRELGLRRRRGGSSRNRFAFAPARGGGRQRQRCLLRWRVLVGAPLAGVARGRRGGGRLELAVRLDLCGI